MNGEPTTWAERELGGAQLGDVRRSRRVSRLLDALAEQPTTSVPQACGDKAATKAAYRLLANEHVAPAAIRAAHQQQTRERIAASAAPLVLLVQDTTELNFGPQPHIAGLGPINTRLKPGRGMLVHSTLAVSPAGVPLGLLDQRSWARAEGPSIRATRRARSVQQKESAKWLRGLEAATAALPSGLTSLIVADREADVYDLFLAPRSATTQLLIRAAWDRRVTITEAGSQTTAHLWPTVRSWPEQERRSLLVPRADRRPERTACVSLRWGRVQLQPPQHRAAERLPDVPVTAVLVEEVEAPTGVAPLHWLLLTTLPIASNAEAWQATDYYRARWRIEQYHYVLKSGCQVERLQLDTAERLERALALYSVVAWRLLAVTYAARHQPEGSVEPYLSHVEWQTLWRVHHRRASPPVLPPPSPPSLREAVRWIAQLGGFLGRKGDGEPGVKTLWRGWQRLEDLTLGYQLALLTEPSLQTSG